MVDCRRKRMRILVGEVHGLATYPAYSLGLQDLEAGGFKGAAVSFLSVCSNAHKNSGPTLEPAVVMLISRYRHARYVCRGTKTHTQKRRHPVKDVAPVL